MRVRCNRLNNLNPTSELAFVIWEKTTRCAEHRSSSILSLTLPKPRVRRKWMHEHLRIYLNCKKTVSAIVDGAETPRQLNSLITISHSLADVFLRSKRSAWSLMEFHGMTSSDLAFDCIAELYRRDEQGHLIELKTYFEGFHMDLADNEGVFAYVRRLVFSKVNNHLFALMGEAIPRLRRLFAMSKTRFAH